jgi:hypothetical protein
MTFSGAQTNLGATGLNFGRYHAGTSWVATLHTSALPFNSSGIAALVAKEFKKHARI